jgi:hypothetical protein
MSDIRFIDSLNVGAYNIELEGEGNLISINNNVDNYVITATGQAGLLQGEPELQFDSVNLSIGGASSGLARLEIYHTGSVDNLILIKNTNTNTGIQVNNQGVFQLLEFNALPTAVAGGIVYSNNEFFAGIETI